MLLNNITFRICMTHVPETGARKTESIYGAGFWSVCYWYLQIAQSVTRTATVCKSNNSYM